MTSSAPNLVKSGDLHVSSVSEIHCPPTVASRLPSVKRTETSGLDLKRRPYKVSGVPPVIGPVSGDIDWTA